MSQIVNYLLQIDKDRTLSVGYTDTHTTPFFLKSTKEM